MVGPFGSKGECDLARGFATTVEEAAAAALKERVAGVYGQPAEEIGLVRSPYRICPLGAHVDHQLGQVSGMALDRSVLLAFSRSSSGRSRIRSEDFSGEVTFDLGDIPGAEPGLWGNYTRGAALGLVQHHGIRRGIDGLVQGFLPVGGVSSSAAVGVAYLLAFEKANGLDLDAAENVNLDQYIENSYVGLQNGILDQSVILLSRKDELLHLDCRTRRHESLPFSGDPTRMKVLLAHSGLGRVLISTDYNKHVAECREAASRLLAVAGEPAPETPLLGLVSRQAFEEHGEAASGMA